MRYYIFAVAVGAFLTVLAGCGREAPQPRAAHVPAVPSGYPSESKPNTPGSVAGAKSGQTPEPLKVKDSTVPPKAGVKKTGFTRMVGGKEVKISSHVFDATTDDPIPKIDVWIFRREGGPHDIRKRNGFGGNNTWFGRDSPARKEMLSRHEFSAGSPTTIALMFCAPGYVSEYLPFQDYQAGTLQLVVRLGRGQPALTVRLVDKQGRPCAGYYLDAVTSDGRPVTLTNENGGVFDTDDDGRIDLHGVPGVPGESVTLRVWKINVDVEDGVPLASFSVNPKEVNEPLVLVLPQLDIE